MLIKSGSYAKPKQHSFIIVPYTHLSSVYGNKVLWKVYEQNGQLRAVCQTEEEALHFIRPL